jgi:hypothetical protein
VTPNKEKRNIMNTPLTAAPAAPRRRKRSLRLAVAGIAVLAATPAAASVVMQNFARVDVNTANACMVKVLGADSTAYNDVAKLPYIAFADTASISANGANLINEQISITGLKGDRLLVSDAMRVKNTCNYPISVQLTAEADAATPTANPATSASWTGVHVKVFVASSASPALPAAGKALPFTALNGWDMTPIAVSAAGSVTNAQTGSVTIAANAELQVGAFIDADRAATAGTRVLRFTVSGSL